MVRILYWDDIFNIFWNCPTHPKCQLNCLSHFRSMIVWCLMAEGVVEECWTFPVANYRMLNKVAESSKGRHISFCVIISHVNRQHFFCKRLACPRNMSQAVWVGISYSKEAPGRHTATVIWLHGLGDTGEGWMDVGPQLQMQFPNVAWRWTAG